MPNGKLWVFCCGVLNRHPDEKLAFHSFILIFKPPDTKCPNALLINFASLQMFVEWRQNVSKWAGKLWGLIVKLWILVGRQTCFCQACGQAVASDGKAVIECDRMCEEYSRSLRVLYVDNTLLDLQNSSYPTKTEFNNCFIVNSKYFQILKLWKKMSSLFFCSPKIAQPRSQVFSINGSITCNGLHFWRHWFNMTKSFPDLVNRYGELCVWF